MTAHLSYSLLVLNVTFSEGGPLPVGLEANTYRRRRRRRRERRDLMNNFWNYIFPTPHAYTDVILLTLTTYSMFSSRGYLTLLLRPNEFTTRCCTVYVVRLSGFWCN